MFGGFGVQVDVDECPDVSGMSNITAMPTFILYARGQEVARETGANPAKLRALLQKATYGTRTHTHTNHIHTHLPVYTCIPGEGVAFGRGLCIFRVH